MSLVDNFRKPESRPEEADSLKQDEALWSDLDSLRKQDLVRYAPLACSQFEHQLLRLEELSSGGEEYAEEAAALCKEVKARLSKAAENARNVASSHSIADHCGMTTDASWMRLTNVGHNLSACEYFGSCDAKQAAQIREMWKQFQDASVASPADSIVEGSGVSNLARQLLETQFLAALRQQRTSSLWGKGMLADALKSRVATENLGIPRDAEGMPGDERAHYFARFWAAQADDKRCLAEDLLFAGGQNAANQAKQLAQDADELVTRTNLVMKDATAAFQLRDDVFAKGPYLAAWLCDPANDISDRDKLVNSTLIPMLHGANDLSDAGNRMDTIGNPEFMQRSQTVPFRAETESVQADFDAINGKYEALVTKLSEHELEGCGSVA